eukprot:353578-Chlamydomonas_euryale.AAC.17
MGEGARGLAKVWGDGGAVRWVRVQGGWSRQTRQVSKTCVEHTRCRRLCGCGRGERAARWHVRMPVCMPFPHV